MPPRRNGSPAACAACRGRGVADDGIVHEVGDVAALVRVQAEREVAEDDRLDVEHQVAADEVGRVADLAAQEQARRLERAARDDDGVAR